MLAQKRVASRVPVDAVPYPFLRSQSLRLREARIEDSGRGTARADNGRPEGTEHSAEGIGKRVRIRLCGAALFQVVRSADRSRRAGFADRFGDRIGGAVSKGRSCGLPRRSKLETLGFARFLGEK